MSEASLYESHCHTPLCRHAVGEPEEYAAVALARGLAGITITCHGPTPYEWSHCMRRDEWPEYLAICRGATAAFDGRLDVRTGVECDFLPDLERYWKEFLPKYPLSHVLGSVHPQMDVFRQRYWNGDTLDFQKAYFDLLARAAETRLFDTLAHPDLVKNCAPRDWNIELAMPFIERALDRIAAAGTAMELNTSGLLKSIPQMNPAPEILSAMATRGIPVVLGADAHVPERVAADYETALDLVESCGFREVSYFVDRELRNLAIGAARASLRTVAGVG